MSDNNGPAQNRTLDEWKESYRRIKTSSFRWDQVSLSPHHYLGLMEHYFELIERQTDSPEVWQRLDRANERLNEETFKGAQKSERIKILEAQVATLEQTVNEHRINWEVLENTIPKEFFEKSCGTAYIAVSQMDEENRLLRRHINPWTLMELIATGEIAIGNGISCWAKAEDPLGVDLLLSRIEVEAEPATPERHQEIKEASARALAKSLT